jgi:hypothetical protein
MGCEGTRPEGVAAPDVDAPLGPQYTSALHTLSSDEHLWLFR